MVSIYVYVKGSYLLSRTEPNFDQFGPKVLIYKFNFVLLELQSCPYLPSMQEQRFPPVQLPYPEQLFTPSQETRKKNSKKMMKWLFNQNS